MITKNTTLKEVVSNYPQTIEVLNSLSIDFCCGGNDTIEKAVNDNNGDLDEVLNLLIAKSKEKRMENSEDALDSIEKFKTLSIVEMINSLERSHHLVERKLLQELDELINTILLVHYHSHKEQLIKVHSLFGSLKTELEEHFAKEEKETFKIILNNPKPNNDIIDKIKDLESDHDAAGNILKELKVVTNNFTPPDDGCYTYNKSFEKLEELVNDVFVHVFKENSILFPEYIELA